MLWCDIRAKDIILSPGVYTPGGLDKSLVQNMFYDVQQLLFVSLLAVASGVIKSVAKWSVRSSHQTVSGASKD